LEEIRLTVGVPDYWEELKRSQESIAVIRREDFENTPFTEDEQRQISAQLREIKNQLNQFALSSEQASRVAERLDDLVEASHHLGRKDWLIIVITTISP
jgi:predicted translin family RNA/ssDNA-binding protein